MNANQYMQDFYRREVENHAEWARKKESLATVADPGYATLLRLEADGYRRSATTARERMKDFETF